LEKCSFFARTDHDSFAFFDRFLAVSSNTTNTTKHFAGTIEMFEGVCPVCGCEDWTYSMNAHGLAYFACDACALVKLSPRPTEKKIKQIYRNSVVNETDNGESTDTIVERARSYWRYLKQISSLEPEKSHVLILAAEPKAILEAGYDLGFKQISSYTECVEALKVATRPQFDSVLIVFGLEKMEDPIATLRLLHRSVKPDGILLLVAPMLDSWPAQFFREAWTELRPENLIFFSTLNIQSALGDCGFNRVILRHDRPRYTLHHIYYRACMYPKTQLTRLIRMAFKFLPHKLMRKIKVRVPSSAFIIAARKTDLRQRKLLSIVMPVFNESKTFLECFNKVLAKEIKGVDKEIVVVESNSTDGTRALVQQTCVQDGVKVIFQDRARGKGNAVRAGLKLVKGDIVLIQDADLEYDVNDYDALIHPILSHRTAFVLGSRHTGSWKMREFNDQVFLASFFNFGHVLFRGLLNLLYGQSLKDPFTMYKVFRADCLYGLDFQCNRFDFDFEIVIKLIQKGYTPLEVPVNYKARSFKEGKKVSTLRDPWTWLRALVKYRFYKAVFQDSERNL
jgi:SAM-dependent methyltransferase